MYLHTQLQEYCDEFVGCINAVVVRLFPGSSIGVEANFIMEENSPTTGSMVMETVLDTANENNDDIGDFLYITPARTTVNGVYESIVGLPRYNVGRSRGFGKTNPRDRPAL